MKVTFLKVGLFKLSLTSTSRKLLNRAHSRVLVEACKKFGPVLVEESCLKAFAFKKVKRTINVRVFSRHQNGVNSLKLCGHRWGCKIYTVEVLVNTDLV